MPDFYHCPLCGKEVDSKTRFTIPEGFRLFGLSISQIRDMLNFARQHGWEKEGG